MDQNKWLTKFCFVDVDNHSLSHIDWMSVKDHESGLAVSTKSGKVGE